MLGLLYLILVPAVYSSLYSMSRVLHNLLLTAQNEEQHQQDMLVVVSYCILLTTYLAVMLTRQCT